MLQALFEVPYMYYFINTNNNPSRKVLCLSPGSHFAAEAIEAQRREVTCPRSHSW